MGNQAVGVINETDTRGVSLAFWRDCPYLGKTGLEALGVGTVFFDDFVDLPTGKYTATQATAGTLALDDAEYGVALADCNSTTATQGINVQKPGECVKPAAGKNIWYECRVKAADIATGPEFFAGLAITDTTLIASSALSSQAIGFKSVTDDNVILATCKDGSSETTAASIHTLVDDAWVKFGIKIEGTSRVKFYVNGVLKGTITANIPTTELTPSMVCQSGGTTDPIVHIDWHAVAAYAG
jgi:hypothetical protein